MNSTGALGADYYVDIKTTDMNVVLKDMAKGGLPDWKIRSDVTLGDIIGSGRVSE